MRASDAHTIETGISGRELMERAGRAVFENVDWRSPVAIICGTGNNAGDGYVIARLLHEQGTEVVIYLLEEKFSPDGRYFFDRCVESGITVKTIGETINRGLFDEHSTIVDCIFGTGFHGKVTGLAGSVIEAINTGDHYVVSVDINSGLNGESGMTEEGSVCVRSDLTISIGDFKPGHFLNMAKDVMKSKINCDIGIEPVEEPYGLIEDVDLKAYFRPRPNFSHKGTYGYMALVGGSKRYSGAIRLAGMANAAMRAGAGVVKVAVPGSMIGPVSSHILESTVFRLSDDDGEMVFRENEIRELISNVRTVAFGMGIGRGIQVRRTLRFLLENHTGVLIIDADGLTELSCPELSGSSEGPSVLKESKARVVLAPHIGEFSRLSGRSAEEINNAPIDLAREYARDNNVILLLKGPTTVITDGNRVFLVDTGCAGMATAGSGDVLSGILAAVCGYIPGMEAGPAPAGEEVQKADLLLAAAAGAYINGRAGELAQKKYGSISMIAGDTVACIADAVMELS